ncbi:unnamed protein product [Parnassius apollo]|uniref:(apollo) hypothetical protein n=1 Tax=Parnassius apollo TaxID=110799 RepID=A0A8S3X6J8_PARAO|nr:unnamed protein product [Parnassius apollo]
MATNYRLNFDLPMFQLHIEVPLQDIIVDEFSVALLECKISAQKIPSFTWYKDGQVISPSERIKITSNNEWYRLEIKSVAAHDYGVYTIICSDGIRQRMSKANLYVRPVRNFYDNYGIVYMNPCPRESVAVFRHLIDLSLQIGERIELEIELKSACAEDFLWYKSNNLIDQDPRTIILKDSKTSTLSILRARKSDTGLYHVVAKTNRGITSSFAEVIVTNVLGIKGSIPSVIEHFPDELEIYVKENTRIMCKAKIDSHTLTRISKDGLDIYDRFKITIEEYGGGYIGLEIVDPCLHDAGEYTLTLHHLVTGLTHSSSCFLSIQKLPAIILPFIRLLKPMDSVVACFGSKLILKCSFDLQGYDYYFVNWTVGHFRVERSNYRFNVVCNGGDFYLVIKQLEPDMGGLVACELRRLLPNRRSILDVTISSNIIIVPPAFFDHEITLYKARKTKFYYRTCSNITHAGVVEAPSRNSERETPGVSSWRDETQKKEVKKNPAPGDVIMEFQYCRLENNNSCFIEIIKQCGAVDCSTLTVHKKVVADVAPAAADDQPQKASNIVVIKWQSDLDTWYAVDFYQPDGTFFEAGLTSLPMFEVNDPPIEKILKFQIRATPRMAALTDSQVVCISPFQDEPTSSGTCELKEMKLFDHSYRKTDNLIGSGAFGSVVLVKDKRGKYYAAKILKTRTQKKRDNALREFDIMKQLTHPKVVELIEAFSSKDTFVLVMNYLWGAELFERIVEEEHIKEVDVVPYVRQTCEALEYLHALKIVHLDIKPENIICLSPNSRQIKLIDFGLARILKDDYVTRAIYGTRDYVAPEVLNYEQLTLACDMWSFGVVTYMLLSGVMPFAGEGWPQRSANITRANYNYRDPAFEEISDLAKDFVDRLLVLNPAGRMTASMALNHQWILDGPPKGTKAGHMKQARQNLKSYLANYKARWQRAGNVMIAAHRLRNQVGQRSADAERAPLQVT